MISRIYKIPDGKPENKFAFDGEFQNAEFANKIIAETHEYWRQLVGKTILVRMSSRNHCSV